MKAKKQKKSTKSLKAGKKIEAKKPLFNCGSIEIKYIPQKQN